MNFIVNWLRSDVVTTALVVKEWYIESWGLLILDGIVGTDEGTSNWFLYGVITVEKNDKGLCLELYILIFFDGNIGTGECTSIGVGDADAGADAPSGVNVKMKSSSLERLILLSWVAVIRELSPLLRLLGLLLLSLVIFSAILIMIWIFADVIIETKELIFFLSKCDDKIKIK